MEATAVSLARTVLDGVLGSAGTALADEAALLLGVGKEVEFIRNELEMMQSFLMESSACVGASCGRRRGTSSKGTTGTWVKQVRDLANDVEDTVLDFTLHTSSLPPSCAPWLPGTGLAARHRIAQRIRDLKASVEELNQRNQRYHIFVNDHHDPPPVAEEDGHGLPHDDECLHPERTSSEWEVIVRAGEKDDLSALILSQEQGGARVMSVWGMGGMGKSSVARMLYNNTVLLERFDCRAWVTVPHPLDSADEFKRRLMKQLGSLSVESDNDASVRLKEKRCLVVVDDLCSMEEWEHVSRCLPLSGKGCQVVVTTRREDVARHCGKDVYELKPLADGEARKLLCQKVYKDGDYTLPDDMAEQADRILTRCRGLPLAIAAIGGLLANRPKTSREWMKIREHLGSELECDRDIKSVITSSYDGLPYHLKSCFLYLSVFPENHEVRCTRLLRRWMAEGYIAKRRDMTVDEVGLRHYNELINRSMIQPSEKLRASLVVERCRVHGVVLQIILSKSIEENQLFIIDKHCNEVPQSKIRHLVVTRWNRKEKMASINLSLVRSLTVFGECPVSLISPKLRLLRVLDPEDTVRLENDDLRHIGELHHLRYLGLRGTNISRLPSLQNLRCLETLDVQDTEVTQLPLGIAKLEKLRYLIAGVNFAKDLAEKMGKKNTSRCNGSLLEALSNFVCRCCGDHKRSSCCSVQFSVRAPEGIEKLRNLQMLGVVHIAQGSGVAAKLEQLTCLRRLGVELAAAATKDQGTELCRSIGSLIRLERLEVRSDSLEFLEEAKGSPPKHLFSLRLYGQLNNLPAWISSLNDLAKLKLLRTQLKQRDVELLGKMRNLTLLGLWEESFAEKSLCFRRDAFQKLELLYIEGLSEITTIQIKNGALPKLERLRVKKCVRLHDGEEGLSGVLFLRNLNELALTICGPKPDLEKALQRQISQFEKRPKFLIGRTTVVRTEDPSLN